MIWPIIGILGVMYLMNQKPKSFPMAKHPMDAKYALTRQMIINECRRQGVSPKVGLAYAWLESRFNDKAEGDLEWAKWNNGARYQANVLKNPKLSANPFRHIPEVWHSYGLFQLLAPYFVSGLENPRILLDPATNTQRGVKKIASSLKMAGGDPVKARIIYAGASKLSAEVQKGLADKITEALKLIPDSLAS